jgi:DNA-binding beta-propeller fold protein YncE
MRRILLPLFVLLIVGKMNAQMQPAAIISGSETDLIPEGIAVDGRTGNIYVSSIARQKIIVLDANGNQKDFIANNKHGFLEGLGMKVDNKRNLLWAISVKTQPKSYKSQVHAFDLASGKVEQLYTLEDSVAHMFNDLDIDEKGNLFVTDSYYSAIYFIDTEKKKLELFLKSPETKYPNGIAVGKNNQLYIVTYEHGPVKIDISSKTASILKGNIDSTVARGLDGLVYSNNSLIAVFNYSLKKKGFDTALVVKYDLNDDGNKIVSEKIIDRGNSKFYQPTTLALANNQVFVLANSHLSIYNANQQSTKGKEAELTPVTIIKYDLTK